MHEGVRGTSGTILIVDEDGGSVRELQARLEHRGFSTVVAHSRPEALAALVQCRPDLIAVDLDGAHLGGREMVTAVRADEGKRHLPIIAFSADRRLRRLPWAVDDLIGRPVDPEEIVARFEVWLRISQLRQEAIAKSRALPAQYGPIDETGGALARSNLLYELSNQLHSIQDFDTTLQLAAQQILEAFQADGTLISLTEAAAGEVTRIGLFLNGRQCFERASTLDPVAQAVMDAGKPILINRAVGDPTDFPISLLEEGADGLLAVPVQGMSGRHGAVVLSYRRAREFRPLDVETLVVYANHLGIALENARLYAAAKQRAERIAALNRLTRVISSSFDISAVYQAFADEVKPFIPYDRMGIVVPDDSGRGLRMFQFAAVGPVTGGSGNLWSRGEGTGIAWVMANWRPHIEADLARERAFVEDELLFKEGIRSSVRVPLVARGKVIGALFLGSVVPRCYSERELEFLVPVGEQLAIAIENSRLFQEINRLAITDELTGLFNRRHFYHHLEQEFKRARRYNRPLSLIMMDIDDFKRYNDLNGHLAGDQILRILAGRLRSSTRAVDMLARYGGDEFGIILPETDLKQAGVQAERIRSAVKRDPQGAHDQKDGNGLTASLGIACLGPEIREVEDLIRAADQALYRSKAAGGNRISTA